MERNVTIHMLYVPNQLIDIASLKGMDIYLPFNRENLIKDLKAASYY